jgi:nicotinamidase/pyrazinamidase
MGVALRQGEGKSLMRALLLVDIQNGFCPGGNLPVPGGDEVVPVANRLIDSGKYDLIVASQDWHPPGHGSFASVHPGKQPFEMGELSGKPQMMWPDHCVQNTHDAELHPDLKMDEIDLIQQKGEDPGVDSYSAFRDNDQDASTGLSDFLLDQGVTDLDVCGLATDYCVKFSALDALEMMPGVKVRFIEDASRGITPEGVAAAISDMRGRGIAIVRSADVLAE